jgi:hypothetical protein
MELVQGVACLPSMHKTLVQSSALQKKKKKRRYLVHKSKYKNNDNICYLMS